MPLIAGHDIHVATVGAGAPAVLLHGVLVRHEAFLPLVDRLDQSTTLFDLPGHGRSSDWDNVSEYQSLASRIAGTLCNGPTHIIGHSFGATAALRLAVERPELVNRLTLIEPVYFAAAKGTDAHRAHAKAFRPFVGAMLRGDEDVAAQIFNDLWGEKTWQELSPRRRAESTQRIHLIVAGAGAIEEDADGITSRARLRGLKMPVTLIRGSESPGVVEAIHHALEASIPYVTDHIVTGAGHMLPVTHASEVAEIIRAADQGTG